LPAFFFGAGRGAGFDAGAFLGAGFLAADFLATGFFAGGFGAGAFLGTGGFGAAGFTGAGGGFGVGFAAGFCSGRGTVLGAGCGLAGATTGLVPTAGRAGAVLRESLASRSSSSAGVTARGGCPLRCRVSSSAL